MHRYRVPRRAAGGEDQQMRLFGNNARNATYYLKYYLKIRIQELCSFFDDTRCNIVSVIRLKSI